jgi:FHS family L-fucose permease-like MFS transporter
MNQSRKYLFPFILVTSLFFLWAFLHNINPILIPHLKKACQLSDMQSAFIDTAVYLAYFSIALPAGWMMHRYGYKKGILMGLLLYGLGALLFIPAAATRDYPIFLCGLFVMAAGATFLETVANPYITKLGDPKTATQRLNLAQSFNGVGAFVAPIIGGQLILSGIEHSKEELNGMTPAQLTQYLDFEASTVKLPYVVIGAVVLLLLVIFYFAKLPDIKDSDAEVSGKFSFRVFRYIHLKWAVIAQFFYVGAQVCVGSFFVRYSRYVADVPEKLAAHWWFFAMVGFMLGRFSGTFLMKYVKPVKLLAIYGVTGVLLLCLALVLKGNVAVYVVMVTPFFMSIMFPTIFAIGISGLGEESKIGSSFLVMSIVGGAFFPLIMGRISDLTGGNIQVAYIVPLICFAVVAFFAIKFRRLSPENISAAH